MNSVHATTAMRAAPIESACLPQLYAELLALALKTLIAATVATVVGFVLLRVVPFTDPIDIVGPPLMRGYSELAEQWALYGFWLALITTGLAMNAVPIDWKSVAAQRAGGIALLLLAHAPLLAKAPMGMPVYVWMWTVVYLCGGGASHVLSRGFGALRWPWLALLVWCCGFHGAVLELQHDPALAVRLALALMLMAIALYYWGHRVGPALSQAIMAVVIVAMLRTMRYASFYDLWLGLSAAAAYGLGAAARQRQRSLFLHPLWLLFVVWTAATAYYFVKMQGVWPQVFRGLGGVGLAAAIHWLLRESSAAERLAGIIPVIRNRLSGGPAIWLFGSFSAAWFWRPSHVAHLHPRLAAMVAICFGLFVILHWSRSRRPRWWSGIVVAAFLSAALVPVLNFLPLDHFHDGYNLSCAWAFESGSALYTEILPIRSYQFFVTWLSRQCLPQTVDAYLLTFSVLQVLPVLGAFALSLVWTRGSLPWSTATAIVVTTASELDSRQAVHLLLAAGMLGVLRRDQRRTGWLIAVASIVAGCCGFDTLCPFAMAMTLTAFCVPNAPLTEQRPAFLRRVLRATQAAVLSVVPFSAFIAAWQGWDSALEHWRILRDFSTSFNVFSGLPINWYFSNTRFLIVFGLTALAVWVSFGIGAWRGMSPDRRRGWLFLMIQFGFLLHRSVGRSDESHLRDLALPSAVLLSLGAFDLVRSLRRDEGVPVWFTTTRVAWFAMAAMFTFGNFFALTAGKPISSRAGDILRSRDPFPLGESPYVQRTVAPTETLWAVESTTSNYANGRTNPTRHPLAHIICSTAEQRRAVADLQRRPPRLIEWPTEASTLALQDDGDSLNAPNFATVCAIHSHDEIASPLRYYLISQAILPRYRPTEELGFLERAPADWNGLVELRSDLNESLSCQRLPLVWGEQRAPRLISRIGEKDRLPEFQRRTSGDTATSQEWELETRLTPRRFNYLFVTFATAGDFTGPDAPTVTLQFAPDDWNDQTSSMTFVCPVDSQQHTYLLPMGCCPAWVWRSRVRRLRLQAPADCQLSAPQVEAWYVDELRSD